MVQSMVQKTMLGTIFAVVFLAGCATAPPSAPGKGTPAASPPTRMTCNQRWCELYVEVVESAGGAATVKVEFDEIRMAHRYPDATLLWKLVGSPRYEFRADSIFFKGDNAGSAPDQFPIRESHGNRFALDNKNTNSLKYTYGIRVYLKDSPPGSPPAATLDPSIFNDF